MVDEGWVEVWRPRRQICSDCLTQGLYTCGACWSETYTCKYYSTELVRVWPSSWHDFPRFNLGKVHQGLTPYEHTDQCLLAFIKGILFPVSGWFWEGQGRSLCQINWAVPGGRAWRQKSSEQDFLDNVCPPNHQSIYYLSTKGIGGWSYKDEYNISPPGSREYSRNIYGINDLRICISFTLITISYWKHSVLSEATCYQPIVNRGIMCHKKGSSNISPTFVNLDPKLPYF